MIARALNNCDARILLDPAQVRDDDLHLVPHACAPLPVSSSSSCHGPIRKLAARANTSCFIPKLKWNESHILACALLQYILITRYL
jgi:hypothetical protein